MEEESAVESDGFDTDLEIENDNPTEQPTSLSAYMKACTELAVVPASYFMKHIGGGCP